MLLPCPYNRKSWWTSVRKTVFAEDTWQWEYDISMNTCSHWFLQTGGAGGGKSWSDSEIPWQAEDEQERKRKKPMTASLMSFVSPPQIIVRGHNSNRSVSPSFGENVCTWRGYRWRYSQQCFSAGDRLRRKVTRSQYAGSWRSLHLWDSWA